jgi:hypothetical protein
VTHPLVLFVLAFSCLFKISRGKKFKILWFIYVHNSLIFFLKIADYLCQLLMIFMCSVSENG